jgi:hypothetical protein
MKHNDKSESLQKRCHFIVVFHFGFLFFFCFSFSFSWWGGGGLVTKFDVFVCNQWTASIIAHCDELLLVEIVAYKNTDIQDA